MEFLRDLPGYRSSHGYYSGIIVKIYYYSMSKEEWHQIVLEKDWGIVTAGYVADRGSALITAHEKRKEQEWQAIPGWKKNDQEIIVKNLNYTKKDKNFFSTIHRNK